MYFTGTCFNSIPQSSATYSRYENTVYIQNKFNFYLKPISSSLQTIDRRVGESA